MLQRVTQIDGTVLRASQALHAVCGFVPTDELPYNCWGEPENGTILYRFSKE